MGCVYRESCRELFNELEILPLSLLLFTVNNRDYFVSNSVYHYNNTRQRNNLHLPQVTLATYQKKTYYSAIKILKGLPKEIKDISSKPNKFKTALMHFLYTHSF